MRSAKVLPPFMTILLISLACRVGNITQPIPTTPPTKTQIIIPRPTQITIPTPFSTNLTATPIPAWVANFADPIIAAVANHKPDFQDDFSIYRGWLNRMSGVDGFVYAERYDGMLFLRLPEKTDDSILYNPKLNHTNFVLTFELRFDHDQPADTVRFQFEQSPHQSVAFELSNNRNWTFLWGHQDNWKSVADIYEHFPPENIPVTIIMQGTHCAVYLNNDPLTYSNSCRTISTFQSQSWVASFRLLGDAGRAVAVNFDNLKLWDLDKIPDRH